METEDEISQEIDEFFERTCITNYIFKKITPSEISKMKKKTPLGSWTIKSVELGYFIDMNDQVILTIQSTEDDKVHEITTRLLRQRAKTGA